MDYRYLNHYTVVDAIIPPDIAAVIQRIGRAKYITTFDGKSSYWTVPIKKEHRWLTGIVCDVINPINFCVDRFSRFGATIGQS
jgi:hypothetical protein